MRVKRILGRTALTAALMGIAFTVGVTLPDFQTVHDTTALRAAVQRVPNRLGMALFTAAHGDDNAVTPAEVYADVLTTLQNNYFGLQSYGDKVGGTGIVLDTNSLGQVYAAKVLPNTPAAAAGVHAGAKDGDIIRSIDGSTQDKTSQLDLSNLLWGEPGTTAHITLLRDGKPVDITLTRALLPQVIDPTQMTYNGIRGMMGSLKDRYTRFLDPPAYKEMMSDEMHGEFVGIGAMLGTNKQSQVYVVKVLANGPAMRSKVMAGDIIMRVNGRSTIKLPDTDVVKMIRGEPNTKVTLTMLRGTATKVLVIPRGIVKQEVVQHAMIDPVRKIGYVSLLQFNEESDTQIARALSDLQAQGMRGLIFDLRGNPGGLLDIAQEVASRFIPAGPVVWIKSRTETMATMEHLDVDTSLHHGNKQFPLIVLVDGNSASAAEIVSGAIKDTHSGTLIGEKTFGKGVVQTISTLSDKSAVLITTQHYYTAAKNDINHKGIMPDITVKFTDDQTRKHYAYQRDHPASLYDLKYDPQLQRGVSVLETQMRVASAGPRAWKD